MGNGTKFVEYQVHKKNTVRETQYVKNTRETQYVKHITCKTHVKHILWNSVGRILNAEYEVKVSQIMVERIESK